MIRFVYIAAAVIVAASLYVKVDVAVMFWGWPEPRPPEWRRMLIWEVLWVAQGAAIFGLCIWGALSTESP